MTIAKRSIPSLSAWASSFKALLVSAALCFTVSGNLYAKGINMQKIVLSLCPDATAVEKKTILLSPTEAKEVMKKAHVKLRSKIVRIYLAKKQTKVVCYGIILSRKVRTKKAAVLYMIDSKGTIKNIEIVAFAEPPEFMPKKEWLAQFQRKKDIDSLRIGRKIPTITGATLSARNITEGARVALAIYETVLRKR